MDYSELGVFVATRSPPPLKSWGVLRLDVAGELFDIEALVVRIVPPNVDGLEPGFAAELVALPRDAKLSILQFLGAAAASRR